MSATTISERAAGKLRRETVTRAPPHMVDDRETERLTRERADAGRGTLPSGRTYIVIQHADGASVVPLTSGITLTVGRSEPADLVVPDASLSRLHARFCLTNGAVVVEDLGSTNGTIYRSQPVERIALARGDQVMLGAVSVTVHGSTIDLDIEEIGSHDRFVRWVDEEVKRARFFRRPMCVVIARPLEVAATHELAHELRKLLRPIDRIGQYAHGVLEIVAPEISARELRLRLLQPGREPSEGLFVFGIAQFPDMAMSSEELVFAACAAQRRATPTDRVALAVDDTTPTGVRRSAPSEQTLPIAKSSAMQEMVLSLDRVARALIPVLLVGETGTGKEVLTRYMHAAGPRREKPLVSVNCAAIPAQLVESTLFGHERGAFTGATHQSVGVFEAADGGSVFLDEIGELPAPAQAALLRVLETKRFTRVGSTREIAVDVRVIAATHRDLDMMVASGAFRQDLLYRLNTIMLRVPPLRERREDIHALALELLELAAKSQGVETPTLDPEVLPLLAAYGWPGNVRELRNVLERAVAITRETTITVDDLPERLRAIIVRDTSSAGVLDSRIVDLNTIHGDYRTRMERIEAELLRHALEQQSWNQTKTAQAMDIPLRTLVHKIKNLGVKKPAKP